MSDLFIIQLALPSAEVDAVSIRRMSDGAGAAWTVSLTHRFGSVLDKGRNILGPQAPYGVGTSQDLNEAFTLALADLRLEVDNELAQQNEFLDRGGEYQIKTLPKPAQKEKESAEDLLKLLDL